MLISSEEQAALRQRFNPDGSPLRQMQLRMLDMLKYIDKICRDNDIHYWLSSGTCLGAVRHGGFIPWDDDADIEMLKPDYKKFCNIIKNIHTSKYVLQTHGSDFEYLGQYAKLRDKQSRIKESNDFDKYYKYNGIFIDVFCIEPSNSLLFTRISGRIQEKCIFPLAKIQNNFFRHVSIVSVRDVIFKSLFRLFSLLGSVRSNGKLRHIHGSIIYGERRVENIKDIVYLPFEDIVLPVPHNYDAYLNKLFGDYKNLPNLDTIQPHLVQMKLQ